MNIIQALQIIFREYFDDPSLKIDPSTSPATLPDWDSVAQVHIVLAIEETFEMRFTTDEVAKIRNVADLLTILGSRA